MTGPPKDAERHFAAKLARLMRERGLSSEVLAERAQLGRGELDRILGGACPVPLDTIFLLAGALEVTPAEMLDGIAWVPGGSGGGEYRVEEEGDG